MKSPVSMFVTLALFAAACTSNGSVFEPSPGLECSTNYSWSESATIRSDAIGAATPAEAIREGSGRWKDRPELVLTLVVAKDGNFVEAGEGTYLVTGAFRSNRASGSADISAWF